MKLSTITAKAFAIVAVTALALAVAPAAKAGDMGCSNATLKGTFAHRATGFTTAPPDMAGPVAGVGTDTFDGNGGITGAASLNINGNPVRLTYKGTYKVNPDCTGTYTIVSPAGTIHLVFVIADSGNEIQAICIDPGTVTTHIFRRQFPEGDWRQ